MQDVGSVTSEWQVDADADMGSLQIHVPGDLTYQSAEVLRKHMLGGIVNGYRQVILDLERVGGMESSCLGVLCLMSLEAVRRNVKLLVTGQNADIQELLQLTGLDDYYATVDQ